MDFTFYMPVRVLSGPGCVRAGGELLRGLGRRCLVMTGGRGAKESGALDDMLDTLKQAGVDATIFPGVGQNPLVSQCQQAAYAAEICRAEFVVGVGGGSVMDAAKAAAWLAANRVEDTARLFAGTLRRPPLPLVLVGTTAGTGSEVSPTAVLTLDTDMPGLGTAGRKKSITHPSCYARYAFADPRYTASLPRKPTVSTALDALAHAVEGYCNPACGDVAAACAEKALPLISGGLRWLAENPGLLPDEALREELLYGSLWAGLVLNAMGTAYPHPFGYILTEDFGIPHGMACAVFLPSLSRRAEAFVPARAQRLFTLCGGREAYYGLLEVLIDAPVTMTEEAVQAYAARWEGLKNLARTPGGFTVEEGRQLFRELFVPRQEA